MKFLRIPFYIILIALFPTLSLMGSNLGQANIDNTFRPILFSLIFSLLIFLIVYIFTREINLAGIISLVLLLAFFSYGHVFTILDGYRPFGIRLSRNSILLLLYLILVSGLIYWVYRKRDEVKNITPYINIAALVLLILPVFQIGNYSVNGVRIDTKKIENQTIKLPAILPNNIKKPDIYLIVLDGYNREDTLKSYFNYDNSEFISDLRKMGFKVADCSMSNYNQTRLVLASELNLDYMDKFFPLQEKLSYQQTSTKVLSDNSVRRLLENSGYQTYVYDDLYYPFLKWEHVEHILSSANSNPWSRDLTAFETMFLDSTFLKVITLYRPKFIKEMQNLDTENVSSTPDSVTNYLANRAIYMLDTLPELAKEKSPKFVYAHFTVTHTPFVFTSDGKIIDKKYRSRMDDALFKEGYNNQVDFINGRLLPVLQKIIDTSKEPPIIILESDHGIENYIIIGEPNRPNQNLIAIYMPGVKNDLNPKISPVNIFRYVFNNYFGLNLPYLDDISYQINNNDYSLQQVTDDAPGCR